MWGVRLVGVSELMLAIAPHAALNSHAAPLLALQLRREEWVRKVARGIMAILDRRGADAYKPPLRRRTSVVLRTVNAAIGEGGAAAAAPGGHVRSRPMIRLSNVSPCLVRSFIAGTCRCIPLLLTL